MSTPSRHIYETLPDEQHVIRFVRESEDEAPRMKLNLWLIPACIFGAAVWAGVGYLVWRAIW